MDNGAQKEIEDFTDDKESNPIEFWEKKQRELFVSIVDYNLKTLADLVQSKDIDLSPEYQRRCRWKNDRKSKLIESFLMNVPVPPIFLNEDESGNYAVIDGKQRLIAIHEFFYDKIKLSGLEVYSEANGYKLSELPQRLQTTLKTRPTLRSIIILEESTDDLKFEVFRRINSGGITLNAQEIRNGAYPGTLNNLLLELSENKLYCRLLGIKNKRKSVIYQQMKDVELVLRYFTFKGDWTKFSSRMRTAMDSYMKNNKDMQVSQLQNEKQDFLDTIEAVDSAFGEYAFRRYEPEKKAWKMKPILASLYDAEMFACKGLPANELRKKRQTIIANMKKLFEVPEFRQSIDAATNTPQFFNTRKTIIRNMLEEVLRGK